MDCGIKGCDKPAVNTYSYSAPLKPSPYGEKLIVAVPFCKGPLKEQAGHSIS